MQISPDVLKAYEDLEEIKGTPMFEQAKSIIDQAMSSTNKETIKVKTISNVLEDACTFIKVMADASRTDVLEEVLAQLRSTSSGSVLENLAIAKACVLLNSDIGQEVLDIVLGKVEKTKIIFDVNGTIAIHDSFFDLVDEFFDVITANNDYKEMHMAMIENGVFLKKK